MNRIHYSTTSRDLAEARRAVWKAALTSLWNAARRVHRYRDVHTGMMREALCRHDRGGSWRECGNE